MVKDQEEQAKLSFIGSGEWTLRKEYNQFQERVEQFYQMTQRQRNQLIEKFNSLPVKSATLPMKELSVTLQNCVLLYPPFSIIEDIFAKAAEILNSSAVITAPGTPAGTFVVQNLISPMEPLVVVLKKNFESCCQAKCKRYHAYQICEHCLAVAEKDSVLLNFLAYHKKRNTSKYKQMQISDIAEVGKDRRCGKKATKATSKRYGQSNTNRKSLTCNLTKSNENRDFSNSFCPSVRPDRFLSPSSSNVTEGTSDLLENPIIDKETLPTTSTTRLHILKQATVNMEANNNSFMAEMLVPTGMPLPPKPNLTEPQMNPYYVVKSSGKVSKCNGCSALFDKRNHELYILKRNELDW